MKFGDIFRSITGKDPSNLTLITIEKEAIKNPKYKKYGGNLVLSRGSIFKNKFIDIDKNIDEMFKRLGFNI